VACNVVCVVTSTLAFLPVALLLFLLLAPCFALFFSRLPLFDTLLFLCCNRMGWYHATNLLNNECPSANLSDVVRYSSASSSQVLHIPSVGPSICLCSYPLTASPPFFIYEYIFLLPFPFFLLFHPSFSFFSLATLPFCHAGRTVVPRRRRQQPRSARLQLISQREPERALSQVPRRPPPLLVQGDLGNWVIIQEKVCACAHVCVWGRADGFIRLIAL